MMLKKIILIVAILFLVGCSVAVTPHHTAAGEELCKNNGGLQYLDFESREVDPIFKCNDGAVYTTYISPVNQSVIKGDVTKNAADKADRIRNIFYNKQEQ